MYVHTRVYREQSTSTLKPSLPRARSLYMQINGSLKYAKHERFVSNVLLRIHIHSRLCFPIVAYETPSCFNCENIYFLKQQTILLVSGNFEFQPLVFPRSSWIVFPRSSWTVFPRSPCIIFSRPLWITFDKSISHSVYPTSWKSSLITPVLKSSQEIGHYKL